MSGNGVGAYLRFELGGSTTYRAAAGWQSGNLVGVTGSVSVVGTNGANFYLTGVKLEIGSVATPFNRQSLAKSMADCQRYYQVGSVLLNGYASAAGQPFSASVMAPTVMRLPGPWAPSLISNSSSNWTFVSLNYSALGLIIASGTAIAAGAVALNVNFAASAEL